MLLVCAEGVGRGEEEEKRPRGLEPPLQDVMHTQKYLIPNFVASIAHASVPDWYSFHLTSTRVVMVEMSELLRKA